jgi:pyruvate kinase
MNDQEKACAVTECRSLLSELLALRAELVAGCEQRLQALSWTDAEGRYPVSASNLAHYLAMRCRDLRLLQIRLAREGLSSLGRVEPHVLSSIDQVIRVLAGLCGHAEPVLEPPPALGFDAGNELLVVHTRKLFGPPQPRRAARIMVTMPSEAASDETLVRALLESGMDCARINCAHDDAESWRRMIEHIRRAAQTAGRQCRILMDLAGHKIRTSALAEGPSSTRIRAQRGGAGLPGRPAILALLPDTMPTPSLPEGRIDLCLTLNAAPSALMAPGDRLAFTDLRGKKRHLVIDHPIEGGGWVAHCSRNSRMGPETVMWLLRLNDDQWVPVFDEPVHLGGHQSQPVKIRLQKSDHLRLTGPHLPGVPAVTDVDGRVLDVARIGVTEPRVLQRIDPGQPVWIDDGKVGGIVEAVGPDSVLLKITQCPPGGFRLRADKGINLPGADLDLGPLSTKDLDDLDFVVRNADLVGFSFVETAADMRLLMDELERRDAKGMGIVAKIETERALRNLAEIMLSTIGKYPLGIMIARGDLAVEIGGERLAEIQEEILWLAEAGHVPVIWATQVLETMAKTGAVSRPELSDAAMSGRAECVMLNKGPFILTAVRSLDGILHRMQEHQFKKISQLRALHLARPREGMAGDVAPVAVEPQRQATA